MSALTKNERDGLDEVFRSIHTSGEKYSKFRDLASLIFSHETHINFSKLIKQAKYTLKKGKFPYFLGDISKKKKNLSK